MSDTRDRYTGKRAVLYEALINHDPYDQFAWCQGWRFALAQYLTDHDEYVPDFRGSTDIREGFEFEMIVLSMPSIESVWYALKILDRFREWLRLAGEDY
jgi:hypothetical protein